MSDLGLWKISNSTPLRLTPTALDREEQLENWIEADPSLVQEGLVIVGRQISLPSGRLDLLGIDPFGRIVVIENKRDNIRRKTITQALDYVADLSNLSVDKLSSLMNSYLKKQGTTLKDIIRRNNLSDDFLDDPEFIIYVVGTGQDDDLEQVKKYINIPLYAMVINAFQSEYGETFIARQFTELDAEPSYKSIEEAEIGQQSDIERLFTLAHKNGIGESFRLIYEAAVECGLYPRTYKWGIRYAPPADKRRYLIYTPVKPKNSLLSIYVTDQGFAEFYPVSALLVSRYIGWLGYREISTKEAQKFADKLLELFSKIKQQS